MLAAPVQLTMVLHTMGIIRPAIMEPGITDMIHTISDFTTAIIPTTLSLMAITAFMAAITAAGFMVSIMVLAVTVSMVAEGSTAAEGSTVAEDSTAEADFTEAVLAVAKV